MSAFHLHYAAANQHQVCPSLRSSLSVWRRMISDSLLHRLFLFQIVFVFSDSFFLNGGGGCLFTLSHRRPDSKLRRKKWSHRMLKPESSVTLSGEDAVSFPQCCDSGLVLISWVRNEKSVYSLLLPSFPTCI